jgi:D-alanyl-D-alanine carboxypeptidase (penicillin-binding protein 5/6)
MAVKVPNLLFPAAIAAATIAATSAASAAVPHRTTAREAILVDMTTDTVLLDKNADQRMAPASMTKMMTAYLVFEALDDGRLSLDERLPVSERAWRMGGSKMFVEVGNRIRVEDLLRGLIVQSGNDAAVVLAEGLGGSEAAFAQAMTQRARQLGMKNTHFVNASGWPAPDHYSTASDMATLAEHLITDYPKYYRYFAERDFTYHGIHQGNRNPLLYRKMGVDGLKTGHSESSGYGLAASAERDGRRLVLVVNGLPSMQARADQSARLLEWGFRTFKDYKLFEAGEMVEAAPVWMGEADTVPLVLAEDLAVTLTSAQRHELEVSVVMDQPVPAPIDAGTTLGTLVVKAPDLETREVPLEAGTDVAELGPLERIPTAATHLLLSLLE